MPAPPRPTPKKPPRPSPLPATPGPTEVASTTETRRLGSNARMPDPTQDLAVSERPGGVVIAPVIPIDDASLAFDATLAAVSPPSVVAASKMVAAAPPPAEPAASGPELVHEPGEVIAGKYRLTRIIGRGGMGSVWLAHNIPLDIDVAIKLIRRDRTADGAGARLLQEARAAARLKHPSIVRVFDYGESERGDPFIVMELLHGESLSAILRRKGRLAPAVAVQTLLPVAGALASAHARGVVHRDLKPDNILLVNDESGALVPKVVDFGIAKVLHADVDRANTLAGEILGSPDYMSPEQARGAENVGEATDVWGLSVVLYEVITGRRPFEGANYNALIAAILTFDPQPISEHGVADSALWNVLRRGLARDVATRWSTMRELGAALAAWAVERGIEDDAAGNPIARQWLSGATRRLLTVYPDTTPSGPSAAPSSIAPPSNAAPVRPAEGRAAPSRSRAPWLIAPALVVVSALGYVGFRYFAPAPPKLDAAAALTSAEAVVAPGPSSSATAAPEAPVVPAAATVTAPAADPPEPTAAPSASATAPAASTKAPTGWSPKKKKAPPAPKSIRF